jgi:hypothetical protein
MDDATSRKLKEFIANYKKAVTKVNEAPAPKPEPAKRYYGFDKNKEGVYDFIIRFKIDHQGSGPTMQEIADNLGHSGRSVVRAVLLKLEEEGRIVLGKKNKAGQITIPGATWTPPKG